MVLDLFLVSLAVFAMLTTAVSIPALAFWYTLGLPLLKAYVLALLLGAVVAVVR